MQWSKVWAIWLILCNHCRFLSGKKKKSICLEVSHMTFSQISVSKASHVATLNFKVMDCNSTKYPKETEGEQP